MTFSNDMALENNGPISATVKPAIPHAILVT